MNTPRLGAWIERMPFLTAVGLCLLFIPAAALAQNVIEPAPQPPVVPPALQAVMDSELPPDTASVQSVAAATPGLPLFQVGPVVALPHFFYRFLYGDGIQATPGQHSTTAINDISPGILLDFGAHWSLDYTPTWNLYSNPIFKDSVGEDAQIVGWAIYGGWNLNFSQGYTFQDQPLIETGSQTSETEYTTAFDADYQLNTNLSANFGVDQTLRFAPGFPNSLEWSTMDWLNYQASRRLIVGLGGGLGYVDESTGSNEFYLRSEARLTLHATDKITIVASGGLEDRQFIGQAGGSTNDPIYHLSVEYRPDESTTFSVGASRQLAVSLFASESTKTTELNAKLDQRLLKNFYLDAEVSNSTVDYIGAGSGSASAGRGDDQVSYTVRLSTTFLRKGTIAILYQRNRDSSNFGRYGFSSNQFGFESGYRF